MNAEEFRANLAGYLDSAETLLQTVRETIKAGEKIKMPDGRKKIDVPPVIFSELLEASETINRGSNWILSPKNNSIEKGEI